ncbi:hypothetical protein L1987_02193 [Smallanthus sonchifolius]|uniref:Uncharacterized protein n=1 Tax=Smallanthus sonchifolius TaxID=185202 RepID=A0ACB9K749_9ASTR|nr:hypothetical protein L1987_02193 [Smallanthus sonchifolius]
MTVLRSFTELSILRLPTVLRPQSTSGVKAFYTRSRLRRYLPNPNRSAAKASWDMVKDLMADGYKRDSLADRAKSLLLFLKHTGELLASSGELSFNIVARIDDLLYVDDLTR